MYEYLPYIGPSAFEMYAVFKYAKRWWDHPPSTAEFVEFTGMSKPTVIKAIDMLVSMFLIKREYRKDPDDPKLNLPNIYTILKAESLSSC